ncbi:hypothetical protein WA026_007605 [Henosepilachna vigintioctopunctata]|uniref:BTB domain-containing protein n=1 Tax=Henosepilachna vigintioctopunctata TaxID=420089 RepID=A0AAW1UML1_9CUCU
MEDVADNIILIIEEEQLECSKSVLLNNSEYFKVLLEGNFREKNTKYVTLQEVEAKSMRDLLILLSDRSYFRRCDDIYAVLATSSMFLFEELKMYIISEIDRGLSPKNCLEVWSVMEKLHINELHWKAKSLSLLSFDEIKQNGTITSLSLPEVCNYLGHVNLQCDGEFGIFECAMHWFLENHKNDNFEDNVMTLIRLIKCIGFKTASTFEVVAMTKCEEIKKYPKIAKILKYICIIKYGVTVSEPSESYNMALSLLNSKIRYMPRAPALLINKFRTAEDETDENKMRVDETDEVESEGVDYDEEETSEHEIEEYESAEYTPCYFYIYFYGNAPPVPKVLGQLRFPYEGLTGYVIQSYMSKVYVIGGEYFLGRGLWNREVRSLDIITGKISKNKEIPSPRRHFESCVCGEYCFIVGGTGTFRLNQDNMYWYNFKKDTWSEKIKLPCLGRQLKCCSINKSLFIISYSNKCGYLFNGEDGNHDVFLIEDPERLIPVVFDNLHLFYYNDKIYLKGDDLIEMEIVDKTLKVSGISLNLKFNCNANTKVVACHNNVYTLYFHEQEETFSLEYLNLDTKQANFIFESKTVESLPSIDNVKNIRDLFAMYHYELVAHNTVLNSW